MNSVESTESAELQKYLCRKCVFELATSCVTNQHATTVPARHMLRNSQWTFFRSTGIILGKASRFVNNTVSRGPWGEPSTCPPIKTKLLSIPISFWKINKIVGTNPPHTKVESWIAPGTSANLNVRTYYTWKIYLSLLSIFVSGREERLTLMDVHMFYAPSPELCLPGGNPGGLIERYGLWIWVTLRTCHTRPK